MKYFFKYYLLFVVCLLASCKKDTPETNFIIKAEQAKQIEMLPFTEIELNNLSIFKPTTNNWTIVGNIIADRNKEKTITSSEGIGILLNTNNQDENKHIFTSFDHGGIELEFDVMMPVNSNSGIYFQGRYEVQLFDSWGVETPKFSDIGAIYQRWDASKPKGEEGYQGHPPRMNAAKAPGLWQHFKIIFHAPKFDEVGNKIKNAWFEEVWLNGVLVQENIEVLGPTREAAFETEAARGPLMIQGDHGPVAFKNIKYKLYEGNKLSYKNLIFKEYKSDASPELKSLDSLELESEAEVNAIDVSEITVTRARKVLVYSGVMLVPELGKHLFEMELSGGGILVIDNDTIINMNRDYKTKEKSFGEVVLTKHEVPFTLIYNKSNPWRRGFEIYVEGPNMQKYSIQDPKKLQPKRRIIPNIEIDASKNLVTQRSFIMHKGEKRTHCISVGSPQGVHYAYDLEGGALLNVWNGSFLDAAQMWHSRGVDQIGEVKGLFISSHGALEFANLSDEKAIWPKEITEDLNFKQLGYEFNESGIPKFLNQINGTTITNMFEPSETERRLKRIISIDGDKAIWHKIAEGESIETLLNGSYIINNEGYYIDFSDGNNLEPIIRNINGTDELLLEIPSGKHNISYSIVW